MLRCCQLQIPLQKHQVTVRFNVTWISWGLVNTYVILWIHMPKYIAQSCSTKLVEMWALFRRGWNKEIIAVCRTDLLMRCCTSKAIIFPPETKLYWNNWYQIASQTTEYHFSHLVTLPHLVLNCVLCVFWRAWTFIYWFSTIDFHLTCSTDFSVSCFSLSFCSLMPVAP